MPQHNVMTSGAHLAKALVTPTGGGADRTLADIAHAAVAVASTNAPGRVELATNEETTAGTDAVRAVTPAGLAAQDFITSADVTFKTLNDNAAVGNGAGQIARGNHTHANATGAAAGFMSLADKAKLDGIETNATADQTGAEIVAAVNTELGGTEWQQGGEGGSVDLNIPGLPKKLAAGGADLVPIWDAEAAAHRHVTVAGLPAGRGIVAPAGDDPAISMELPVAVDRRDFLLGFTATGAVTTTKVATAADVDQMAARGMMTVTNIAEMRATTPRGSGSVVHVRGYSTAGDGGGGVFMWDAAATATSDGGTIFEKAGGGTGRWRRQINEGMWNVRWFGALPGSSDAAPGIQAALNTGRAIHIPAGAYRIYNRILWSKSKINYLIGESAPRNATVTTSIEDFREDTDEPMFHNPEGWMKSDCSYTNDLGQTSFSLVGVGSIRLENIAFSGKLNQISSCVEVMASNCAYIANCSFRGSRGLTLGQSTFDNVVIRCQANGHFTHQNDYSWSDPALRPVMMRQWGFYADGHTYFYGLNCKGIGCGVYLTGTGSTLSGMRCEVSGYGAVLGGKRFIVGGSGAGSDYALARSVISALSFEANLIGMSIGATRNDVSIEACAAQGTFYASMNGNPNWRSLIGIEAKGLASSKTVKNCGTVGNFALGAIINYGRYQVSDYGIISGSGVSNTGLMNAFTAYTNGNAHIIYQVIGAHAFNAPELRRQTLTTFHDLMLPGLTGLNFRDSSSGNGAIFAKNFGEVETVASGSQTKIVTFTEFSSPNIGGSLPAVVDDPLSQLDPGKYYYATTLIAKHGEVGRRAAVDEHNYRSVDIGPEQKAVFTFSAVARKKRRIYRGRSVDTFEGYWDDVTSPFTDDGTVGFTSTRHWPPVGGNLPDRNEEDTNYQILVQPSWDTTAWVTAKETTGFTINFGTAAPDANQTVAWLLFRP